ncbi:hypothetical protein DR999_PMT01523 [Platysternon megacephalum]|uniref:Uncharacterized protein n=1 Tax=Platysternon megacephalum TaxID=55544 RepID=A0A4D9F2K1_9SAUR|nr:hypothetical protein DR999_PMT01523 [Platysternon megacephalum]
MREKRLKIDKEDRKEGSGKSQQKRKERTKQGGSNAAVFHRQHLGFLIICLLLNIKSQSCTEILVCRLLSSCRALVKSKCLPVCVDCRSQWRIRAQVIKTLKTKQTQENRRLDLRERGSQLFC